MDSLFENIWNAIRKGGEISPFLFLGQNLEILHHDLELYLQNLLKEYEIDSQSLFTLKDLGENLKIAEVKNFLTAWEVRPRFAFQIFFIEDISRMTPQAQNACLKFFEEPGEWNIIVLTASNTSWVLETILSRVKMYTLHSGGWSLGNEFYYSLISSHVKEKSDELVRYFFSGKYEKQEYITFLESLIVFISDTKEKAHLLDEIHEDISGIMKNNLQGRYIVDKYIMLLS